MIQRWSKVIARLSLTCWLGAAIFFVAVAIRPIRSPFLDSQSKALLASLLFPGYYAFGFSLLSVGWVATCLSEPRRRSWQLLWISLALGIAAADWIWIYSPLAEMTRLQWVEQAAPPASFRGYHLASMAINSVGLLCSAIAAILACRTERAESAIKAPT
ncbi:MAG: hypothetical protein JWN70_2097 [Planctomycetaceae bacterium]|nr:hypothetical protein [Planctomycetaceae bacterium]